MEWPVLFKEVLSGFVAAVLGIWIILTLLNQERRTRRFIKHIIAYDIFGLIPIWTFFAPNPGDRDVHLLFRDRCEDGRITSWREVHLAGRRRITDLWNPRRRINKAIVDVVYDLTRPDRPPSGSESRSRKIGGNRVLTFPYLLILNYISRLPAQFDALERQFAIAKTQGITSRSHPEVLLVSPFHGLP